MDEIFSQDDLIFIASKCYWQVIIYEILFFVQESEHSKMEGSIHYYFYRLSLQAFY